MRTVLDYLKCLLREVRGEREAIRDLQAELTDIQKTLAVILQAITTEPQPAAKIVITLGTPEPQTNQEKE